MFDGVADSTHQMLFVGQTNMKILCSDSHFYPLIWSLFHLVLSLLIFLFSLSVSVVYR